jgi:hypothetical protein
MQRHMPTSPVDVTHREASRQATGRQPLAALGFVIPSIKE